MSEILWLFLACEDPGGLVSFGEGLGIRLFWNIFFLFCFSAYDKEIYDLGRYLELIYVEKLDFI